MLKLTLIATALTMLGALLVPPQVMAAPPPSGIYRIPGTTPVSPGGHLIDPCFDVSACGGKPRPLPLPPIVPGTPHCGRGEMCMTPPGQIRPLVAD